MVCQLLELSNWKSLIFMPVKTFRPLTPSLRYVSFADYSDVTKHKPEKSLVEIRKKTGGRNHYGRVTARGIGGGNKQKIRLVDFKRNKHGVEATVAAIEYDPMRSARLALLQYKDGEKRYIIAPVGIQVGGKVMSGPTAAPEVGNSLPLKAIPVGLAVHNIELTPGRGGQMVRTAGGAATLMSRDEGYAQLRLPSGEIRRVNEECYATIGQVGNPEHENVVLGKAGRSRHLGIRPVNRGVTRNPVDHPNGGGAGKSKSGGGWQQLTSPWGLLAKGYRTREKRKLSNRFIVVRRDGRPMKNK
jgi:large subunit ribosomal protein L2